MSTPIQNATPASLRKPVESARSPRGLAARPPKPVLVPGVQTRADTLSTSSLAALPQEPEDARMTGVTRSLNRRLLALNVRGSLLPVQIVAGSRIA